MQHRKNRFYAGFLTTESATEGMRLAGAQAAQLAHDAKVLLDAGSYPTAAALATLSIEESSKSIALRSVLAADCTADLKKAWAGYRSHGTKSILWRLLSAGLIKMTDENPPRVLIDFSGAVQRYTDLDSEMLNGIKQAGLYTDCVGEEPHWVEPRSTIAKEFAESLVAAAQAIASVFAKPPTSAETELWAKHMAPIATCRGNEAEIAKAVDQWVKGLIEGGFLPAAMPPDLVIK